ncbi:AraC family transcriptional regulator [Zavarzinia aquatilis]|uniref:HTH araC/xylS-type domain-containing protein n=1 Tax=Zavarzinia aquatilis TaxID=2211142 RepID=A0A317DX17_9PROT|nr:AraC family transcriptional regulator [Zavarzinia aquatilis]PWR19287.1 hypothetical protein DKG74_17565 [Zavarzinia aquatilis]
MIGSGVLSAYVATLIETAAAFIPGGGEALAAAAGIEPALLTRPDAVLPLSAVDRLWQAAAQATGDPAFGIAVGRRVQPGSYSVLGQVMMTAADLGGALAEAGRLTALVGEGGAIEVGHEPGRVLMRYRPLRADWPLAAMRIDAALAGSLTLARWITGLADLAPEEVRLTRAAPRDAGPWQALFAAPLRFGAPENALVWRRAQLSTPVRAANEALNSLLRRHADDLVRERLSAEGMVAAVRRLLAARLAAGMSLTAEAAAAALNTSLRSLQRALDAAGTSFTAERDRLRQGEAQRLLAAGTLTVEAIALRLGYAEAAVFVRAFRRWTGQSPARWRKASVSASPSSASSSGAEAPGTGRRP